jgi:hypothetical protein
MLMEPTSRGMEYRFRDYGFETRSTTEPTDCTPYPPTGVPGHLLFRKAIR